MTFIDFSALPPEINSSRMHSGPGPTSLIAAQNAWNSLSESLYHDSAACQNVVEQLTAVWAGISSQSMTKTMTAYTSWLSSTASQVGTMAACIGGVINAYSAALAGTVPPALIVANRSLLATLVATNLLGQNTAKIAQLEAEYQYFWAQDATAMNTYAATALPVAAQSPNPAAPAALTSPSPSIAQTPSLITILGLASDIGDVIGPAIMDPAIIGSVWGAVWGAEGVAYGAEYAGLALERQTYAEEHNLPPDALLTPPPLPYTPMGALAASDSLSGLSVPKSWTQLAPEMRLAFAEAPALLTSSTPLPAASPMLGQTPPVLAPITSAGNNRTVTPKNADDAKRKAARGRRTSLHD